MIWTLALSFGSLLGAVPVSAVDVAPKDFSVKRDYRYVCGGSYGTDKGVYAVELSPEVKGGAAISVSFWNSYGESKHVIMIKDQLVTLVKKFHSADALTWYFKFKSESKTATELQITPGPTPGHLGALISLRVDAIAFDQVDCIEEPPFPKATSK